MFDCGLGFIVSGGVDGLAVRFFSLWAASCDLVNPFSPITPLES